MSIAMHGTVSGSAPIKQIRDPARDPASPQNRDNGAM
jgi:hypothetical protein